MLYIICIAIASILFIVVITPFFVEPKNGNILRAGAAINSPEKLLKIKEAILKRYIEDEKAYEDKQIGKLVWEQRSQYLTNRYIDTVRRLDYLGYVREHSDSMEG